MQTRHSNGKLGPKLPEGYRQIKAGEIIPDTAMLYDSRAQKWRSPHWNTEGDTCNHTYPILIAPAEPQKQDTPAEAPEGYVPLRHGEAIPASAVRRAGPDGLTGSFAPISPLAVGLDYSESWVPIFRPPEKADLDPEVLYALPPAPIPEG